MKSIGTSVDSSVASIVLDRPASLNALDVGTIDAMADEVARSAADDDVAAIVVTSSSDRAFSAGADLLQIRESVLAGRSATEFFAREYDLMDAIASLDKPYVSLIDGIAMGGGLGIAVHGSHRIVTENCVLAMPETAIGFVPDVGSSYFLPRLPGSLGRYIGLTGTRIGAGDAVASGLATHFVPKSELGRCIDALTASDGRIDDVLMQFAEEPPAGDPTLELDRVGEVFDRGSLLDVIDSLTDTDPWSRDTRAKMLTMSPTSLFAADELMRRGAMSELRQCLDTELTVAAASTAHADFVEGVRAVLVEKDRIPRWSPLALEMVSQRRIAEMFG